MTLDLDILIRVEHAQLVYEDLAKAKGQRLGDLRIAMVRLWMYWRLMRIG